MFLLAADFTRDNRADLLVFNSITYIYVITPSMPIYFLILLLQLFVNKDIGVQHTLSYNLRVTPAQILSSIIPGWNPTASVKYSVADFDGDGIDEVFAYDTTGGRYGYAYVFYYDK